MVPCSGLALGYFEVWRQKMGMRHVFTAGSSALAEHGATSSRKYARCVPREQRGSSAAWPPKPRWAATATAESSHGGEAQALDSYSLRGGGAIFLGLLEEMPQAVTAKMLHETHVFFKPLRLRWFPLAHWHNRDICSVAARRSLQQKEGKQLPTTRQTEKSSDLVPQLMTESGNRTS